MPKVHVEKQKNITPFKEWLGASAAQKISKALKRAYPNFNSKLFLKDIDSELNPLELKARMQALKNRMVPLLPEDPRKTLPLLVAALRYDETDSVGLQGFLVWPLTHYVAEDCLNYQKPAMKALYKMTQVFTSEFAVRPFLLAREDETLKQLQVWSEDENEHIRRWTSEGTRPLLPWGIRLKSFVENPNKTWSILENLKDDASIYVQKSVANHINDHSKYHTDWVLKKMKTWQEGQPNAQDGSRRGWIVRHGTRTLVKNGVPKALALQGIKQSKNILIQKYGVITKKIRLGESLQVFLNLENKGVKKIEILVDHQLFFLKSRGVHNLKIFKGKKLTLKAGESQKINFNIPIKSVTTRRYYSGQQKWSPLVNGQAKMPLDFYLQVPE